MESGQWDTLSLPALRPFLHSSLLISVSLILLVRNEVGELKKLSKLVIMVSSKWKIKVNNCLPVLNSLILNTKNWSKNKHGGWIRFFILSVYDFYNLYENILCTSYPGELFIVIFHPVRMTKTASLDLFKHSFYIRLDKRNVNIQFYNADTFSSVYVFNLH